MSNLCSIFRVKELPHNGTARETQNSMETENEELEISEEESDQLREVHIDVARGNFLREAEFGVIVLIPSLMNNSFLKMSCLLICPVSVKLSLGLVSLRRRQ